MEVHGVPEEGLAIDGSMLASIVLLAVDFPLRIALSAISSRPSIQKASSCRSSVVVQNWYFPQTPIHSSVPRLKAVADVCRLLSAQAAVFPGTKLKANFEVKVLSKQRKSDSAAGAMS